MARPTLRGLAMLCAAATVAAAGEFHGDGWGYRLDLPEGWVQIPGDVLREVLGAHITNEAITYDAGFQREQAPHWLAYPYVLVQPVPYAQLGAAGRIDERDFPRFVEMMTGADVDRAIDESVSPELRSSIGAMDVGRAVLDGPRRRFTQVIDVDIENVGPVRGLLAGHFGRDALVQVAFYAPRSQWDRYEPTAIAITDSFRFEASAAYDEAPTPTSVTGPVAPPRIGRGAAMGAIIGAGVIAVTIVTIRRRRRGATR